MAVTTFNGQFSFKQDSLARLGHTGGPKLNADQRDAFNNSPFMQNVRRVDELCWEWTCSRDDKRKQTDKTFRPKDSDFTATKAFQYDRQVDYYRMLGIDEFATLDDVKKAYKKLSLVYHPDKTAGMDQETKDEYAAIFIEIKNAYLTLGDHPTRRQFDQDRDRDQAGSKLNGWKVRKKAQFDATEVLKKMQENRKPPGKVVNAVGKCHLEKFVFGGYKAMKRQRRVKDGSGGFESKERTYRIDIPRGAREPLEATFRMQGDHNQDTLPDTVVIKLSSKPNTTVRRHGEDLIMHEKVPLGLQAHLEPYISAEAPSVRGRHILLWGRNPFFRAAGTGVAELQVQIRGEGMSSAGSLRFKCILGRSAPPAATTAVRASLGKTAASGSKTGASGKKTAAAKDGEMVVLCLTHMATEGVVYIRVGVRATFGEVRRRAATVLQLRGGTSGLRILRQITGGYTPYPDTQEIGQIRQLKAAGVTWKIPPFPPDRTESLLKSVAAFVDTEAFQAGLAAVRGSARQSTTMASQMLDELWEGLVHLMPDFGFAPELPVLREKIFAALKAASASDGAYRGIANSLSWRALAAAEKDRFERTMAEAALAVASPISSRACSSMKDFLKRHSLGPPNGFDDADSGTEADDSKEAEELNVADDVSEAGKQAEPNVVFKAADAGGIGPAKHGHDGACNHPTILRRTLVKLKEEPACAVEMLPISEPVTLFTKPTCTITFYSNASQPSIQPLPGHVRPRPMFAVSISSIACSKGKASSQWEALKSRLIPVLQATAFKLTRAGRSILPKALDNYAHLGGGASCNRTVAVSPPKPWKRLGDEAFRRGEHYTAFAYYGSLIEDLADGDESIPTLLSNRAACLAKVGLFDGSLEEARRALELKPRWGRAWSRAGLAAASLGPAHHQEAMDCYMRAAECEPTGPTIEALEKLAGKGGRRGLPDVAHGEKEKGNGAMRANEVGLAVAHYTLAVAWAPALVTTSAPVVPGQPADIADGTALLVAVLYSNRSAALCRLRLWTLAVADARRAVDAKGDFAKARNRLGTALLGAGFPEQAYAEFSKALLYDEENAIAKRGRQATLSTIPIWRSVPAQARFRSRFALDSRRPIGTSKIFAISDIHFDHRTNEDWAHSIDGVKFQDDILIVAGNMCDTRNALSRALTTLKQKFRRVFYTPGNHELWLAGTEMAKYGDSFGKLCSIFELCDELGVDCFPAAAFKDVFIVPLLSWYNAEFDTRDPYPDPNDTSNSYCKWPLDADSQVWKFMLKMNQAHMRHPYHGTVITFSHFVPKTSLAGRGETKLAVKSMGCEQLDEQIRQVHSNVHVYGHTARKFRVEKDGVLYVNHYHGVDAWDGESIHRPKLLCIFDGKVCNHEVDV